MRESFNIRTSINSIDNIYSDREKILNAYNYKVSENRWTKLENLYNYKKEIRKLVMKTNYGII